MPESNSFRQVDEKHVSSEVDFMAWSPKMDLIAIANVQGEVVLHRLSWQKVWTLAPPSEDIKVTSMAWRPDGKVLAISYSTGKIQLCDIENSAYLHVLQMKSAVSTLTWVSEISQEDGEVAEMQKDCFQDLSSHFLPKLPPFNKSYTAMAKGQGEENGEDAKKLKGQTELNILIVGTNDGHLLMYAFGVFPVGTIDLNPQVQGTNLTGKILSACLSDDLCLLTVMMESCQEGSQTKDVSLISYETPLLSSRHKELKILAFKFGQVSSFMTYLDSTIQQMCEAWEDILLEMDSKLKKLAEEKYELCSGTVSNDFLRLLMFGTPSEELQHFLLYDLTEKGLKKLGHSIETSYSNIQKLVLKHLQSVGQAIMFHLSDICGMSLWYEKFGVLGLSTEVIQHTINMAGSFMLKASELQQVIDGSMKNFKAFFRWLYVVIQKLSDEPIPPELSKMTQQELNFVAQFLKENFTEEFDSPVTGFKLEKVGQYLKDEDLVDPPDNKHNPWVCFLKENQKIAESPLLYKSYPDKSLIQTHKLLVSSIDEALNNCASKIGVRLKCSSTLHLFSSEKSLTEEKSIRLSQYSKFVDEKGSGMWIYTAFTTHQPPCDQVYIIRQKTQGDRLAEIMGLRVGSIKGSSESERSQRCGQHRVVDVSFYDQSSVSLLLEENCEDGCPILAQVLLSAIDSGDVGFVAIKKDTVGPVLNQEDIPYLDLGPILENMDYRRLENMKASQFAVSGTRKVACVLFSSRRRVRLFLMDLEDEEEDDDEEGDDSNIINSETPELSRDDVEEGSDEDKENTSCESSRMDV